MPKRIQANRACLVILSRNRETKEEKEYIYEDKVFSVAKFIRLLNHCIHLNTEEKDTNGHLRSRSVNGVESVIGAKLFVQTSSDPYPVSCSPYKWLVAGEPTHEEIISGLAWKHPLGEKSAFEYPTYKSYSRLIVSEGVAKPNWYKVRLLPCLGNLIADLILDSCVKKL